MAGKSKAKPGAPRGPLKPGPRPGARYFEEFAAAHKKWGNRWVNLEVFASNRGYAVKRAIERGDYPVPGGPRWWDIKIVKTPGLAEGVEETELWIKRRASAKRVEK